MIYGEESYATLSQFYDKQEENYNKHDAYYLKKIICLCKKRMSTKRVYKKNKCYINYICLNNECNIKMISQGKIDKYLNISRLSINNKYQYIHNNIYIIAIVSLKKDLLIVYKSVNELSNNFTLCKK